MQIRKSGWLSIIFALIIMQGAGPRAAKADMDGSDCRLGTNWKTVDTLDIAGGDSEVRGITTLRRTTLIATGAALGTFPNQQWLTRRSIDSGDSWKTVDTGVPGYTHSLAFSDASGGNDTVYAVGAAFNATSANSHWIVKKSLDRGVTWKVMDDFLDTGAVASFATSVQVAPDGAIYAAGVDELSLGHVIWLVRRSTDGGATWTIVDHVAATGSLLGTAVPGSVVVTPEGRIFVGGSVGFTSGASTREVWTVRISDDGLHWSTSDEFLLDPMKGMSGANGGAVDADGSVVFVGSATVGGITSNLNHWIVRKLSPGGTVWHTIDDVFDPSWINAGADAVTFSRDHELFVTGATDNSVYATYLTRRQSDEKSPFFDADSIEGPELNFLTMAGITATTDSSGNVFTGGSAVELTSTHSHWIVRKLSCDLESNTTSL